MKNQILREIYISADVDTANVELEEEVKKMNKKGYSIKEIYPISNSVQRLFILFEKNENEIISE